MASTEIAFVRTRLSSGKFDERDRRLLLEIRGAAESEKSVFTPLILGGIDAAICSADAGDMELAASELHLIHNLPSSTASASRWDHEHFLRFELPTYLDRDVTARRVIQVILSVADVLRILGLG